MLSLIPAKERKVVKDSAKEALRKKSTVVCYHSIVTPALSTRLMQLALTSQATGEKQHGFPAAMTDVRKGKWPSKYTRSKTSREVAQYREMAAQLAAAMSAVCSVTPPASQVERANE